MTTFLAHTMKREDLFWLAVIEVPVHDGEGQGEVEELLAWFPGFLLYPLVLCAGPQSVGWCHPHHGSLLFSVLPANTPDTTKDALYYPVCF